MFVPINRIPTSAPRDLQASRSPVAANMDVESDLLSPKIDSPRTKGPSWTDDDKEKYQEIISSIGSTVGEAGAPTSYAQLFDLASQRLADLGITKSSTQCKDKWYRMNNRAENETLFNFTRGRSKHGTFGEDKLEVEEPEDPEEGLDSSFVGDDGFNVANGDDNTMDGEGATSTGHRNLVRWEDRERDALIEVVKARRELELKDNTQPDFNSGQLFEWASAELQRRFGIDRTKSSCMIFWRRNIAGTCGFGSGNEATKLVASASGTKNSMSKPLDDAPTMTLRETPTKSKRLQNSLQSQPQPQAEAPSPKAAPRAQSPKLGRKFTPAQKAGLAKEAENGLNPDAETRARLVQELGLTGQQVSGYFGNARFKARKAESKQNGLKEAGGEEGFDTEEPSLIVSDIAPDIGVKTRRSRKRNRSMASVDSDDQPLLTPSIKQAHDPAADVDMSAEEKVYGSRPGMLKRKAPMRDPSLPLLPPPSYEDSMLKASPNPYGSPLNPPPPHLSRSHPSDPPRSSSSRLSLDPTNSSLREASNVPSTAPTSSTSANTVPPNPSNVPADDQLMESILATKVNRIDEEMSSLMRKSEEESAAIQIDEAAINEFDRRIKEIQDQKDVVVAAKQAKNSNLATYAGRIQVLGNRKAQIAKALTDLKAAIAEEV